MKNRLSDIFRYSTHIYKAVLVVGSVLVLLYFYPQRKRFPYTYSTGQLWHYPDLFAPMDFSVDEPAASVRKRKDSIRKTTPAFIREIPVDTQAVFRRIAGDISGGSFWELFGETTTTQTARKVFSELYRRQIIRGMPDSLVQHPVWLRRGNQVLMLDSAGYLPLEQVKRFLELRLKKLPPAERNRIMAAFFKNLKPTAEYDDAYTRKYLKMALASVRPVKKIYYKGERLASTGERLTATQVRALDALKQIYARDQRNFGWIRLGFVLIVLTLFALFLFYLNLYEEPIYKNNAALTLIFINILLVSVMVFVTQRYWPFYVFAVPFIILPVIVQTFFNRRVALFALIVGVVIAALGVTETTTYGLVQTMAGLAALLSMRNLTTRSEMFLSIMRVVIVYAVVYTGYMLVRQGDWAGLDWRVFLLFLLSGILAVVLLHELILLFEKMFGLASDVSLLELLNTNNKLLRNLAEKAPGTFQHSIQVANLAEALANELGANALLVRVGALYHDIGKMKNPKYFTENQTSGINPHENLPPRESAHIIIRHVLDGIEMARKNNLPERIIDFIRTHHGRGLVYYFYNKAKEQNPEVNPDDFRYPGPNPFSKETAILMMADSVEAASKSLALPTAEQIDTLVDQIIDRQLQEGLLMNSDLSLKEISKAKKVLKSKLKNIYHLRVAYPEMK